MTSRIYKKEMGITHPEFFRLLPIALGTGDYAATATSATMTDESKSLHVELGPEGRRQIALLSIPQTSVTITLDGYSDVEAADVMAAFDRAYQRGGG